MYNRGSFLSGYPIPQKNPDSGDISNIKNSEKIPNPGDKNPEIKWNPESGGLEFWDLWDFDILGIFWSSPKLKIPILDSGFGIPNKSHPEANSTFAIFYEIQYLTSDKSSSFDIASRKEHLIVKQRVLIKAELILLRAVLTF